MLLDTAQGADWYIAGRVRNRDTTGLLWMLELDMTALSGHFAPTIILKSFDYLAALICV